VSPVGTIVVVGRGNSASNDYSSAAASNSYGEPEATPTSYDAPIQGNSVLSSYESGGAVAPAVNPYSINAEDNYNGPQEAATPNTDSYGSPVQVVLPESAPATYGGVPDQQPSVVEVGLRAASSQTTYEGASSSSASAAEPSSSAYGVKGSASSYTVEDTYEDEGQRVIIVKAAPANYAPAGGDDTYSEDYYEDSDIDLRTVFNPNDLAGYEGSKNSAPEQEDYYYDDDYNYNDQTVMIDLRGSQSNLGVDKR
jgi:hypothetical protein